jgi:hypothetical protein
MVYKMGRDSYSQALESLTSDLANEAGPPTKGDLSYQLVYPKLSIQRTKTKGLT